jgi:hypothetical protein
MHCAARLSPDGKITSASLLILFPVKPFTRTSLSWFLACDDMPRFLSCQRRDHQPQTAAISFWPKENKAAVSLLDESRSPTGPALRGYPQ